MNIRRIALLLLNGATAMTCPRRSRLIKSYLGFTVTLIHQKNTACSENEQHQLRDTIADGMASLTPSNAGGPRWIINGDICTNEVSTNDDDVLNRHRSLAIVRVYTWYGRAACQLCSKLRRRTTQGDTAQEVAFVMSNDLRHLIITTYVGDLNSCLHDDWATVVVVNVTETTQTPKDPCE